MTDEGKTKAELVAELQSLRRRIEDLEGRGAGRSASEGALHKATHEYDAAFDAVSEAVSFLDAEGRIRRCNRAMMTFLGKPYEEIAGQQCWELVHGTTGPIEGCPVERARQTLGRESTVLPLGDRWLEVVVDPLTDEQGCFSGAVHIVSDVTERRQAEAERQRALALLEAAEGGGRSGSWSQDLQTGREEWSLGEYRLHGASPDTSPSYELHLQHVHPEDRERHAKLFAEHLASRETRFSQEYRNQAPDGSTRHIQADYWIDRDDGGQPLSASGTDRDITEHKQREQALVASEERFRALFEQAGGYCMILDPNTPDGIPLIVAANMAACKAHGYTREEFIGRPVADVDDEEGKRLCAERTRLIMTGKPFFVENTHVRKDGSTFPVSVHANRVDIPGKPPLIFTVEHDITERKRAEEELEKSEARYRRIVETTREGVWVIDANAETTFVNERLAEMLGYNAQEMLGRPLFDFVNDATQSDAEYYLERRRSGVEEQHDFRFRRRDGSDLWAIVSTNPMLDEENQFVGALGMLTDITERKRAEEALRTSEEMFRSTFEDSGVGMVVGDQSGRYVKVNRALCEALGYSEDELLGISTSDVTVPGDPDENGDLARQLFAGEIDTFSVHKRYRRKDGQVIWGDVTVSRLRDATGKTVGAVGQFQDITERKRAEEERDRLLTLSQDLICIAGMDGFFKYVNPAWEQVLGYSAEELLSRPFLDFMHPDDHERNDAEVARLSQGLKTVDFENRYICKDGSIRHLLWTATPLPDEKVMYCIGRDITDQKKAAETLQEERDYLDSLYQTVGEAIFSVRMPERTIEYGNEMARRIFGYSGDEFVGQATEMLYPDSAGYEEFGRKLQTALEQNEPRLHSELSLCRKNGEVFPAEVTTTFLRKDGELRQVISVVQDISERKRAEEQLRFLGTIADQVTDSIVVTDTDYRITYVNKAAEALFGYACEELVGRAPGILNAEPAAQEIQQEIYRAVSSGESYTGECLNRRRDGTTFVCEFKVAPMRDERGRLHAHTAVQRDVSDRVRAEAQLRTLSNRLVEVQEAERRRVARDLHDRVGQALTGLGIGLNLVRGQLADAEAEEATRRLDDSLRQVEELGVLVRDVMADLRPPVLDDYGLTAALRWYAGRFEERTSIGVEVTLDDLEPRLPADVATGLFRIAQEAMSNVAKHADAALVTITVAQFEGAVRMAVIDDGVGFSMSQVEARQPDSGWGLITMRERAGAIGGELRVESKPGEGTQVIASVERRP